MWVLTAREARSAQWASTVSAPSGVFVDGDRATDQSQREKEQGGAQEQHEEIEEEREAPKTPASLLQMLMVKDILPPYGVPGRGEREKESERAVPATAPLLRATLQTLGGAGLSATRTSCEFLCEVQKARPAVVSDPSGEDLSSSSRETNTC